MRGEGYEGHSVQPLPNGKDLALTIRTDPPDIVVTDIFMPEMDGFDVMRTLRQLAPGTPIIAISGGTGTTRSNALLVAQQLKASAVLSKPFTARELLLAVDAAVQR